MNISAALTKSTLEVDMAEPKYLTVEHLSTKDIIRIFSKIEVDPLTKCWNWIAYVSPDGYGQIRFRRYVEKAHRLLYAWTIGPVPMGCGKDIPQLDHEICDNRRCCNPAHLVLKSQAANRRRGSGPTAINYRKTHCIKGHKLPDTWNRYDGRYCVTCN